MLATAALLTVAGCSLVGPTAAPTQPFGDFTVGEFGGIDGRRTILHVRPDGVALLIARVPAAGRLSDQQLSRLQTLLTSEQFQEDVGRAAQGKSSMPELVCSDQITNEVTMGNLSMSRTEPCGDESGPTPAFDEIIGIVAPALRGSFEVRSTHQSHIWFRCVWSAAEVRISPATGSRWTLPDGHDHSRQRQA